MFSFFVIDIVRTLILAIKAFTDTRILRSAAALSYSSMLAIVPMVAVVFAIARGFGFSIYIESWFMDIMSSQPQVAEAIIRFVNSYLVNVRSGVILGFGLLVMLWTVIMLISNVENTFNDIWNIKSSRGVLSTIIDYVAFFFLLPIVIVVMSGFSIYITTLSKNLGEFVAPVVRWIIAISPYVIMSVIFIGVYMLMPNTKVKFKSALGPGILAGVAMQLLQLFYIHSQIWVSSYNAIYGSFAALPLFMLWLQFSWIICLFGVQLCYTNQNMEQLSLLPYNKNIAHKYRMLLSATVLNIICKKFKNGEKACTPLQLMTETGIPTHIVADLLRSLEKARLVCNVSGGDKDKEPAYMPGQDIANITYGVMVDRLESMGGWNIGHVDIKRWKTTRWHQVLAARSEYLANLRNIKIADLDKVDD